MSGDAFAATGLNAGCEVWYSVIAGLFPEISVKISRAARQGHAETACELSSALDLLWALFLKHGSLRVISTAAELLGVVQMPCLPDPVKSLSGKARAQVQQVLRAIELS